MNTNKIFITNKFKNFVLIPVLFLLYSLNDVIAACCRFMSFGASRGQTNDAWDRIWGHGRAFEAPLLTPGYYLLNTSQARIWGILLLALASILIVFTTARFIQMAVNKEPGKFGKYYWRLIVVITGWIYLPVPIEMSLACIFQYLW